MSTFSVTTTASGTLDSLKISLQPKYASTQSPRPAVLYCHAAGSYGIELIDPYAGQGVFMQRIAALGHNCYSAAHAGPQAWGNAACLSEMTASYNTLQALPGTKPGKVALIGASMGGLSAMNWAAANPTKVACIVMTIPVINVTDIKGNDRLGYGAYINSAYGGSWTEGQYGANHNPQTMASAGKLNGIPMLIFYGLTDQLCMPAEALTLKAKLGANVTLVPLQGGHVIETYDEVNHDMIVDFIETHAA